MIMQQRIVLKEILVVPEGRHVLLEGGLEMRGVAQREPGHRLLQYSRGCRGW